MNGMHTESGYAYNVEDDEFTLSFHYELPPTPSIVQLSMSAYYEFDDQASTRLSITRVEFIDQGGVPRHIDYPSIPRYPNVAVIDGLTRVDWQVRVSNCWVDYLFNVFFWDAVR